MNTLFTGASGTICSYQIAELIRGSLRPAIILMNNKSVIRDIDVNLQYYLGGIDSVKIFREMLEFEESDTPDRNSINSLLRAVALIKGKQASAIFMPQEAFFSPLFDAGIIDTDGLRLCIGQNLNLEEFKQYLSGIGYENLPLTESPGEFSVRGEIIDIFPPSLDRPIRIDLFDDIIETISEFNPVNQRSIARLSEAIINPAHIGLGELSIAQILSDELLIIPDIDDIDTSAESYGKLRDILDATRLKVYAFSSFESSCTFLGGEIRQEQLRLLSVPELRASLARLNEYTARLAREGFDIRLVLDGKFYDTVSDYLRTLPDSPGFQLIQGSLASGFLDRNKQICYISVAELYGKQIRSVRSSKSTATDAVFGKLNVGDYVVHEDFGIGRYTGTRYLERGGTKSEYMVIQYQGTDIVYIPMDKIYLVQRYVGSSGREPVLSSLHTKRWTRTRDRARRDIREIAEDLVKLYAKRQTIPGFAFPLDDAWQSDFESQFPYVETDDQLRAADEIKQDMQRPVPMDRLLLGDVGYGKTEVAARAIFKALAAGKQVALMAPTTLLVKQHFEVLSERFRDFPFKLEYLSRFKSARQQDEIIKDLASGQIDFIIGTHSLLSSRVAFRDLGLLVIDEEQRFGVKHKERIKELKESVDVLTISATPIPRTLNMSLMGIKDISLLNTAPGERLPVKTYVGPEDIGMITDAIRRELSRGGQVFIVNHRIAGLESIATMISERVPSANIAITSGQTGETELFQAMTDFVAGHINVLVSTSIIENGIDIPNANTIIILNCDHFGLSELYQMRGRVGRSSIQGYAYLMFKPGRQLTESAEKRLRAIRDFTEFGSGLRLAMVDLELRGGGNVLGEAQSGQIDEIGYEMFVSEVNRAIAEFKGEPLPAPPADIEIQIDIEACIDEEYIPDENMRLDIYRQIARIHSREDADLLIDELTDRFGRVPVSALNLIDIGLIRALGTSCGVRSIREDKGEIRISLEQGDLLLPYQDPQNILSQIIDLCLHPTMNS